MRIGCTIRDSDPARSSIGLRGQKPWPCLAQRREHEQQTLTDPTPFNGICCWICRGGPARLRERLKSRQPLQPMAEPTPADDLAQLLAAVLAYRPQPWA